MINHAKMSLYSKIEDTNADIDIYREGKMMHVENNFQKLEVKFAALFQELSLAYKFWCNSL